MKHPNREEWLSYLYDELELEPQRELERHLGQCEECRANMANWRQVGRRLDTFKVRSRRTTAPVSQPTMRWAIAAAAAVVLLLGGFAVGRMTGVSRWELEAARQEAVSQAFNTSRTSTQKLLQRFTKEMNQHIDTLEAQQTSDYASLRKELETVAVLTEASLRQTANRIGRLANNTPPTSQNVP